jgi:stress-induced morphogen
MPILQKDLEKILTSQFPHAKLEIVDLVGDNNHYSVHIKDKIFAGRTRIEQHKIVNEALKGLLGEELHAMQLKTSSDE